MARIVWIFLALAATSNFCFADEEVSNPSPGVLVEHETDHTNHKTAKCPNGKSFMSECNWCQCHEEDAGSMCTLMGCINWTCESQLAHLATQEGCLGKCTCDSTTRIATCEKIGCTL